MERKLSANIEQPGHNLQDKPSDRAHSSSPPRPAYSPFTPSLATASLLSPESFALPPAEAVVDHQPQWIGQQHSHPINMEENPDAIALRAAISILQSQRGNSLHDLQRLEKLKKAAIANPLDFLDCTQNRSLRAILRITNSHKLSRTRPKLQQ